MHIVSKRNKTVFLAYYFIEIAPPTTYYALHTLLVPIIMRELMYNNICIIRNMTIIHDTYLLLFSLFLA